jgi:hypothetical protein
MSGPRVHLPAAGVHRVVTSVAQKEILVQGKDSMKECGTLVRQPISTASLYTTRSHVSGKGVDVEEERGMGRKPLC